MKEKILELRAQGKTYTEISLLLNCSKGTISYHCGEGQRDKTNKRLQKSRLNKDVIISRKVENFLKSSILQFKRGRGYLKCDSSILYKEAYNKITENPFCYLTGRKIDLEDRKSYQLDHIIPWSKGGSNELDNMGLTCRDANQSKTDLTIEEYLALCKEVLEYNNYMVVKL